MVKQNKGITPFKLFLHLKTPALLFLILLFSFSTASATIDDYTNLYRLDYNASDSTGNNDGTATGVTFNSTAKLPPGAAHLDTNGEFIDTGYYPPLDNFSFSGWFKINDDTRNQGLLSTINNSAIKEGFNLVYRSTPRLLLALFVNDTTTLSINYNVVLTENEWYFITISCEVTGGTQRCNMYFNGDYIGTDADVQELTQHNNPIRIGSYYSNTISSTLIGGLDHWLFYNHSLNCTNSGVGTPCTAGDVYELYNAGAGECFSNFVNTTWTPYYDLTACNISDEKTQQRNYTLYDTWGCAESVNYYENQTVSCDYCSYEINYTGNNTAWSNQEKSCGYRYLSYNDLNWASCCAVTGLPSDCLGEDNNTYKGVYNKLEKEDCRGVDETPINFNVFMLIAGIAVFCLFIGLGARIPFFTIIGFIMVFVLGFLIQGGNVMLSSGVIETVNGSITTIENNYTAWDTGNYHLIGWLVMIAGFFASLFSVFAVFGGGDD